MSSYIKHAVFSNEIKKQSSHYHDCHQIIFVKNGEIEITINGCVKRAVGGDIVIISRFENHSIKIESPEYERYVLRISVNLPADDIIFSLFTNRPDNFDNIISLGNQKQSFERIFDKIVFEHSLQNAFSERIQNILITEIMIYINRALPYQLIEYNPKNVSLVSSVKSEFERNYSSEFDLKNLAKSHNVSVSTLTHTFKKIVGVSVFEYLLSCRMTAAKKLLTKSDMPIGDIVEACGFTDNSNFSRAFKKMNNMSPMDFRKKYSK